MGVEETAEISTRMRASGMSGQCSLDGKTPATSSPSAFLQCCRGRLAPHQHKLNYEHHLQWLENSKIPKIPKKSKDS